MESSYKLDLSDIAASHIGSFDAFIDIYSKRIVEYSLPVYISPNYNQKLHELNTGAPPPDYVKIFIKNLRIGYPKRSDCTIDADEKLYPLQSRISHTTYSAPLYVTFALQPTNNGIECNHVIYKELIAGQIPIMVKSKRCNLRGLTGDKLVAKGEDAQEPGGYFIVRGNERLIRHIISSRSNYPIGVKRKHFKAKDALYTEYAIIMRSQRQDGTIVGNVLCYTEDEKCMMRVNMNKGIKTIPFGTLLKAAKPHMSTSELKKRLLEDFLHNEEMTVHFYNIFQSMIFLEPLVADVDFIENRYLHQLGKACWHRVHMLMKPGSTLAECGLFVMKNYICVQSESLDDKFECLLHMFKKLILLARGYIIPDQIDSLAFQEVTLPGQIYASILKESLYVSLTKLRSLYSIEVNNFKRYLSTLDTVNDNEKIMLEFCSNASLFNYLTEKVAPEIPNKINYFLSTGNINSSYFEFQQNLGWTIIADRMNYFRFMSHFRSVHRGNIFTQMLSTSMRKLLGESWGFLCPVHTPDGTPCGLLTHLSQHARPLTTAPNPNTITAVRKFLKDMGYSVDLQSSGGITLDYRYVHRPAPVVVDGIPIARIPSDEVVQLMDALISAKLDGIKGIRNDFEIFSTCKAKGQMECIHILTFPGRMIRTVKNLKFNRNELIGPISQQWLFIAVNEMELKQHKDVINGGSGTDQNRKLLENTPVNYTHIELEQHGILSIGASCTPFSEFNQSPRNMYQCQMLKQSMGIPAHSQSLRSDGKLYTLITPQSPLVSTSDYRRLQLNNYAAGANAVVAIMAYTGFDMEDAMVINKSSIERGFLRATISRTKVIDAAPPGCSAKDSHSYIFKSPPNGPLTTDGIVRVGELVVDGTPLARIEYAGTGTGARPRVELYREEEPARVSSVTLVTPNPSKNDTYAESIPCNRALIRLHSIRVPDVGDKFASRHGQKGILSMTWRHEDMPFTESGIVPDILFNPHGFPSRMTIGMLIEALAGKSAAATGEKDIDGTTFSSGNDPVDYFGSVLRKAGFRYYGTEDMYSGTTGTFIKTSIFMGCIYYQRLRHMVADKAQVRSTGPIDSLTHQPVQGKKRHGGIRFGEMERDSLISYGAPFLLQDRLLNCSDLHLACICPKCGSLLSTSIRDGSNRIDSGKLPTCIVCNVSCHWVRVPYVLRYLANELASINIGLKFTLSQFGRPLKIRDESLNHKSDSNNEIPHSNTDNEICDLNNENNIKYPNYSPSDFLGIGYDLSLIENNGHDLPFKAPILQIEWTNVDYPPKPIRGWARPAESCSERIGNNKHSKKQKNSLSNKVKVDLGLSIEQVGSGTLNVDYKGNDNKSNLDSLKEFSMYLNCSTYSAGISINLNWSLTKGFDKSIKELLDLKKNDKEEYNEAWRIFNGEFGTHIITFVKMGGRIINTIIVPITAEQSLRDHGINLQVGVETSLKVGDVKTSVGTNVELKRLLKDFKNSCIMNCTVWGGLLEGDLNGNNSSKYIMSWKKSLFHYSMPIELELEPISDLIPEVLRNDYLKFISNVE